MRCKFSHVRGDGGREYSTQTWRLPDRMVHSDRSGFVIAVFVLQDDFVDLKLSEEIELCAGLGHVPGNGNEETT